MGKTGISEFTFGFAFLHEQANLYASGLTAAPILPSLQQEQEEGWDARLPVQGGAYFYQFKLSEYLKKSNAKYRKTYKKNGPYKRPYYRISLHKNDNNKQHNRLKTLSFMCDDVYYAAPEFENIKQFNSFYLNGRVSQNSRLVPLRECHFIQDAKQHYITYQTGSRRFLQHSEIKTGEHSHTGEEIAELYSRKATWRRIDMDFALDLYKKIIQSIEKSVKEERIYLDEKDRSFFRSNPEYESLQRILLHTADMLAVFYGASLVVAGRKSE
jgi:hypothetical protein